MKFSPMEPKFAQSSLLESPYLARALLENSPDCIKKLIQSVLAASEGRYQAALDQAGLGISHVSLTGQYLLVSDSFCAMLGRDRASLLRLSYSEVIHPEDLPRSLEVFPKMVSGELQSFAAEKRLLHQNGSYFWVWNHVGRLWDPVAESHYFIVISENIDQRKRQETLLKAERRCLEKIAGDVPLPAVLADIALSLEVQMPPQSRISIMLRDREGLRLRMGAAPSLPAAYNQAADGLAIGPASGSCGTAAFRRENVLVSDIATSPLWEGYRELALSHGLRACWSVPILNARHELLGIFAVYSPQSGTPGVEVLDLLRRATHLAGIAIERRQAEETITRMAYYDALTGLPNRVLCQDRLEHALKRAQRQHGGLTLVFVDLDHFKLVNDSLGHAAGDQVLREISQRLQRSVREGDTVARLGGDEFLLLAEENLDASALTALIGRMRRLFEQPIEIESRSFLVTASFGVSRYPDDGEDAQTLMRRADVAMYQAKQRGRDGMQQYSPAMESNGIERLVLQRELRLALEREEFILHYQPQLDLASGKISSVEALLRWQHPERGMIPPLSFIPLLEESGLINQVGEWVLRKACAQARRWQLAGLPLRMAVNLSQRQCQEGNLIPMLERVLVDTGLAPELLELELTEGLVMHDPEKTIKALRVLKGMHISLAVDDFGTGYSSLSYLQRLPLDSLKVDKSFVQGLPASGEDAAIITAIIAMAHTLNIKVVAEGVETAAQLDFLRNKHCDGMQGYFLSRPLPAGELFNFVRRVPVLPE
ncbi:sensor domain-containing protein [Thermithiobacillus plumbiphilus]|uniref:EAL domain-containing protein n=1 Tax=Thermithiobacillus plumbiphilus TaxID=1729899 RepID=A0ABU9DBB5_9PROT